MTQHSNKYISSSILWLHSRMTKGMTKNWISELAKRKESFALFSCCETRIAKTSKALNFRNNLCPFSPTVSVHGNENLVMTTRVQPQVLASKMRFLKKIKGDILLTKCGSLEILKSLQLLLLQIERSQRRWFDHVSKMPQENLPNKL